MSQPGLLEETGDSASRPSGLRILEFHAENVKRIEVVDIRPDGDVVQITGANRQGKTSVLDAIWWALEGAKHIQAEPIRRGAKEALIRLDLGEMIVRRTFRRGDAGVTTTLTVETKAGAEFRRPQQMVDSFFNALSLDPLAFTRMPTADRFKVLRGFVPTVDFDEIARANKADYDARRDLNVSARSSRSVATRLVVADENKLPAEPIDVDALTTELTLAGVHNGDIQTRQARREQAAEFIDRKGKEAVAHDADVERLQDEKRFAIARFDQDIATTQEMAAVARKQASEVQQKLDDAGPLPEPIDTLALNVRITEARKVNTLIETVAQRKAAEAEAARLEEQAAALTKAMEDRNKAADEAVAAAAMPIANLKLTPEGGVLLDGVPFEQASDAEQLGASIAIAVALNPRLRVIRVRDGSLLDDDAMTALTEMAKVHDCQIWIERVETGADIGFEMVAGRVRQPEAAQE